MVDALILATFHKTPKCGWHYNLSLTYFPHQMAPQSDQKVKLRSAEGGTKEEADVEEVPHRDIDGGWAWVVVAGECSWCVVALYLLYSCYVAPM